MDKNPETIEGLEITESDDGFAVFDPSNEKVHFLNSTGILILELCNGKNSIMEITELISKSFGLSEMPEAEVKTYIENLYREGLLI